MKNASYQDSDPERPRKRADPVFILDVVLPNMTNHHGTMFGGKVVDLMDRAAFLAATRFANQFIVTASVERIDFFSSVRNGHLVELVAQVVYTGRTSITVKVDLFSEGPTGKNRELAGQGYFHMVSVDEAGRPALIPALQVNTEQEREQWDYAVSLRKFKETCKPTTASSNQETQL